MTVWSESLGLTLATMADDATLADVRRWVPDAVKVPDPPGPGYTWDPAAAAWVQTEDDPA